MVSAQFFDDRVVGGFQGLDAVAFSQRNDALAAEPGSADLGIEIAAQMLRETRVARNDLEYGFVDLTPFVDLDGGHHQSLGPHVGRIGGQAARHRASDIVVVTEDLAEPDQPVAVEDGYRGAQIGDMPDAARTVVGVVPEEDVSRVNIALIEVLEDRLDQGGVGTPRQLAPLRIEERHAVVVLVPDHRRARGSLDGSLDFELGGSDRPGNDFELDRTERRPCVPSRCCAHVCFSRIKLP